MIIMCPNSHEKLTKSGISSSWSLFEYSHTHTHTNPFGARSIIHVFEYAFLIRDIQNCKKMYNLKSPHMVNGKRTGF